MLMEDTEESTNHFSIRKVISTFFYTWRCGNEACRVNTAPTYQLALCCRTSSPILLEELLVS